MAEQITPGWRFIHIGAEGDAVEVEGIQLWSAKWEPRDQTITVAHPTYPDQRHTVWVYSTAGPAGVVEFAAGEFSNGAWGFFERDRRAG